MAINSSIELTAATFDFQDNRVVLVVSLEQP